MPKTDPNKPMCTRCGKRNAQVVFNNLCHRCYTELAAAKKSPSPLDTLGSSVATAQSDADWKALYAKLAGTIEAVAKGEIKATAAQGALLKVIMDRAFGRVTKSQEEAEGPVGIVILPVLNDGKTTTICQKCLELHGQHS